MAHLPVYLFGLYISTCNYGLSVKEASAEISFVRIFDRAREMHVLVGSLSCTRGGRRLYRTGFPFYQQDLRRSIWLRGQYPDPGDRLFYRILGFDVSAFGGIFHCGGLFGSHDDPASFQQKIIVSVCPVSCSGIHGRNVYWGILKRKNGKRVLAKGNI